MTRAFRPDPIPRDVLVDLVDLASRAPSAGKTQGWHLVVLEGALTAAFWDVTLPPEERGSFPWPRLLDAPVIALPLADPQAYLDRYSAPDKAHAGLGQSHRVVAGAVLDGRHGDVGADAAPRRRGRRPGRAVLRRVRRRAPAPADLGIPEHLQLLGAIALGYPSDPTGAADRTTPTASRPKRRQPDQILHIGGW